MILFIIESNLFYPKKKEKKKKNPIPFIYDMNILNIWSIEHIFKKTVVHRVL